MDLKTLKLSITTERLRVFCSYPLITPKRTHSLLQMRAIARAMAVLCASIGHVLTRYSGTTKKLSASEHPNPARGPGVPEETDLGYKVNGSAEMTDPSLV